MPTSSEQHEADTLILLYRPTPEERGRIWSGRSLRYIAGSLTLALTVTLLEGASAAAATRPQAPAAPKKPAGTQAADIPSARVAARLSGKRVEALSERTETSTTWVNKDGSLTTELTAGPAGLVASWEVVYGFDLIRGFAPASGWRPHRRTATG